MAAGLKRENDDVEEITDENYLVHKYQKKKTYTQCKHSHEHVDGSDSPLVDGASPHQCDDEDEAQWTTFGRDPWSIQRHKVALEGQPDTYDSLHANRETSMWIMVIFIIVNKHWHKHGIRLQFVKPAAN